MGGSSFGYYGAIDVDNPVYRLEFANIPNCFTGSERNDFGLRVIA